MSGIARSKIHLADKWLVAIAVSLGMLMSLMDATIVNVAIPKMQHDFGANIHDVQWVVTIYMITQAAVIPTAPYLAAKFGSKRAYVWTLTAFLLGSMLCGFAWNLPSLIFFRLIQGIGGGTLLPLVMTLQYQAFAPQERGVAASVIGIPMQFAPVIGPALGGYLVSSYGWQWAFFINIPLGIIAITVAQKVLRHTPSQLRTHFDLPGFLTAVIGSVTLLYAISAITSGDGSLKNILLFLVGIVVILIFILIELRTLKRGQLPLLNLRRFRDRTFAFSVLTLIFSSFIMFGLLFLIPIYLQNLHHETALNAGLIQMAQALAVIAILPIAGKLSDRLGPRSVVIAGLIILIGAAALMMTLALQTPIWIIIGILILLGCSFGLGQQTPVAAMSRIDKEEHQEVSNGSTLITVLRAVAAPMGVAILSSIVQARSQYYMTSLAAQGVSGAQLQQQSSLLAMHQSFLVAAVIALLAMLAMFFVPSRTKIQQEQAEPASMIEA
ncbi:MDR family MFS transporter [Dictyobacter formicarum]|uniref:MFS-type drug efflux transporter P55 n=1 Tax=Dictyobacter formicarum TaxID=2778368 RepID=A0ABQ3VER0_9CHLR|nr:MDR family MFS transporter [Dictyobacter formicarum]GHO84650.1 MFS transporter [Dictyobacter formicarum]